MSEVVEHGEGSFSRRLRRRRFLVAGVIAALEAILVLAGVVPWWAAVLAAFLSVAVYVGWAQQQAPLVRSLAWVAAASQLVVVLVPVAIVLIGLLALVGLVLLAAIALTVLLLDRR